MRRRALVLVAALALAAAAGQVYAAAPILPGGQAVELARILMVLQKVYSAVSHIRALTEDLRDKFQDVYPDKVIRHLPIYFEPVLSLKNEIERLSCSWRFTPRMERLRLGLFKGGAFCRNEWQSAFGAPAPTPRQDIDEYMDMMSVQRMKAFANAVDSSEKWSTTAHWLMNETLKGTPYGDPSTLYGPGYSERLTALGAAQMGLFLSQNGKLEDWQLQLAQDRLNKKLMEQRDAQYLTLAMTALAAGERPSVGAAAEMPPADPGGEP